ncbi:hypothetical protein RchiOBHm_Chr1g0324381 [Rosa chinensis]|uniref:Uncharacterized protein n=1 Tax=Rosa chinensis TaxID=74649 RepID=A0A2P6S9T0_ROSCH|nr:hypothetical protein RchiOBHm_Chr1g0324381 [Rosa chinensis]
MNWRCWAGVAQGGWVFLRFRAARINLDLSFLDPGRRQWCSNDGLWLSDGGLWHLRSYGGCFCGDTDQIEAVEISKGFSLRFGLGSFCDHQPGDGAGFVVARDATRRLWGPRMQSVACRWCWLSFPSVLLRTVEIKGDWVGLWSQDVEWSIKLSLNWLFGRRWRLLVELAGSIPVWLCDGRVLVVVRLLFLTAASCRGYMLASWRVHVSFGQLSTISSSSRSSALNLLTHQSLLFGVRICCVSLWCRSFDIILGWMQ